jgi:hypothetical protein
MKNKDTQELAHYAFILRGSCKESMKISGECNIQVSISLL